MKKMIALLLAISICAIAFTGCATKEERLKVYDEATKLWGLVAQYDQCVEEMGELIVAINKYKRKVVLVEEKSL